MDTVNSLPGANVWRTTDKLARHLQARRIAPARSGRVVVCYASTASSRVREFQFSSFHCAARSLAALGILACLAVLSARRNLLRLARAEISPASRANYRESRHFLWRHGG